MSIIRRFWASGPSRWHRLAAMALVSFLTLQSAAADPSFTPVEPLSLPATPGLLALDNSVVDLDELSGTPLLINVWASWCRPCLEEIPALNRLQRRLADAPIRLIALNYGDSLADVERFLDHTPIEFEVLLDVSTRFAAELPMQGLPTTFLVDSEGRVRYRLEGIASWDSDGMTEDIRARLGELNVR